MEPHRKYFHRRLKVTNEIVYEWKGCMKLPAGPTKINARNNNDWLWICLSPFRERLNPHTLSSRFNSKQVYCIRANKKVGWDSLLVGSICCTRWSLEADSSTRVLTFPEKTAALTEVWILVPVRSPSLWAWYTSNLCRVMEKLCPDPYVLPLASTAMLDLPLGRVICTCNIESVCATKYSKVTITNRFPVIPKASLENFCSEIKQIKIFW